MRTRTAGRDRHARAEVGAQEAEAASFASGVNRDDVYKGAELLDVELNEHIAFVTEAMRPIARELGLRTAADVPA